MLLQFNTTFKRGPKTVAEIPGQTIPEAIANSITLQELTEKVVETEQFLERLTGYRVHISQVL